MLTHNQPALDTGSPEAVVVETPELDELNGNGRDQALADSIAAAADELAAELELIASRMAYTGEEEESFSSTHTVSMAVCSTHGIHANVETSTLPVKIIHMGAKRETVVMCPAGHELQVFKQKVYGIHGGNIKRISPH